MASDNVVEIVVRAVDQTTAVLDKIGSKMDSFGKTLLTRFLAIGAAIAVVGIQLTRIATETSKVIDTMGQLAAKTDVSVETLSRLQFAGDRVGVSMQTISAGLVQMTRVVHEATKGTGAAAEAFQKLNLSANDLNDAKPEQKLMAIAAAVQNLGSRGEKLDLLRDIFGGNAEEFLVLMDKGAAGIHAVGKELDAFGGTVSSSAAEKSKAYQESVKNLAASVYGLKIALVDSGVLAGMTAFNNAVATFLGYFIGDDPAKRVQELSTQIAAMKKRMEEAKGDGGWWDELFKDEIYITRTTAQIAVLEKQLESLLIKQGEANAASVAIGAADIQGFDLKKDPRFERRTHAVEFEISPFQKWYASLSELETRTMEQLAFLNEAIVNGLIIDPVDQERIRKSILEAGGLTEFTAEELAPKQRDTFLKDMMDNFNFMENAAARAAENMQDAFAEFFMNMGSGLDDLLKSFINVMRRMLAEALAFKAMKFLGVDSFFDKLAGRAGGGGVTAGTPYMVGERGPELFVPGNSGKVMPNSALGNTGNGAHYTTNIDARGADPGLIARLPAILEQRDRRLMMAVQRYAETGIMPT